MGNISELTSDLTSPASFRRERLISRREAVAIVREEFGLPIGLSAFSCGARKLVPCGQQHPLAPPPPATRYGQRHLYRASDIRAWAQRLIAERSGR